VSKRTLYARFADKEAVFLAVVRRLIGPWLAGFDAAMEGAATLDAALLAAARSMVAVALTPAALALHRLVVAEAGRPGVAAALQQGGTGSGIERLCRVLRAHLPEASPARLAFLAEQFQHMVLAGPQSRAAGLQERLGPDALDAWCRGSVALFLGGLRQP
jgi:TetR/AcrR family transcriptional repressor of mexJK operon